MGKTKQTSKEKKDPQERSGCRTINNGQLKEILVWNLEPGGDSISVDGQGPVPMNGLSQVLIYWCRHTSVDDSTSHHHRKGPCWLLPRAYEACLILPTRYPMTLLCSELLICLGRMGWTEGGPCVKTLPSVL